MKHEFSFEEDHKFYVKQPDEESETVEETAEDDSPAERMISETEMNKILAAREKRLKQQITRQTKDLVTKDSLQDFLSDINSKADQPSGGETAMKEEESDKGVKAQLTQLQTQLNRINEENEKLQELSRQKEMEMKLERRKHNVEGILSKIGAVKPSQAFKILEDSIVDDEEIGDAVKVRTPHGDDFVPVEEYLGQFKEENPHLFTPPARSGSGAGSGGPLSEKPRYTAENLRNTRTGGMSWEDYEKNREKILGDIENQKRGS